MSCRKKKINIKEESNAKQDKQGYGAGGENWTDEGTAKMQALDRIWWYPFREKIKEMLMAKKMEIMTTP